MTNVRIPAQGPEDFFVPEFDLKIRGASGKQAMRDVTEVTYRDQLDKFDKFSFTVNNWDAEKRTFKYSDTKLFEPGTEVELRIGYRSEKKLSLMAKGTITTLQPTFPAGGQPTLSVSGTSDSLDDLRKDQRSMVYEKLTDTQIAKKVAQQAGVKIKTGREKEPAYNYLLQENEYDVVFLARLAKRMGYELFAQTSPDGPTAVYFGPSNTIDIVYRLTYGRSLIQFQPTVNTNNQVSKVTVTGSHPMTKEKISETVTLAELNLKVPGGATTRYLKESEEVISSEPIANREEAKRLAKQFLKRKLKEMQTASGSTIGLPKLRAGTALYIDGVGKRFNGRYFVTGTTHTINDSGYTTRFDCRFEEFG